MFLGKKMTIGGKQINTGRYYIHGEKQMDTNQPNMSIVTCSPYDQVAEFEKHVPTLDEIALWSAVTGYKFETGSCTLEPTHSTVQYGPRQAYLTCVPKIYRVQSSGDAPDFLAAEQARLEAKYDCTFNTIQVNQHYDQNAVVHRHPDSNPGHVCMISVGAVRDFVLSHRTYSDFRTLSSRTWKPSHVLPEKPMAYVAFHATKRDALRHPLFRHFPLRPIGPNENDGYEHQELKQV
jgi:hypothetical protein